MVHSVRQRFTFAEYLRLEASSPAKHEFLDGHVWAMAGGTPEHAAIAANLIGLLKALLRGRSCRVYTSDLRVRVTATTLGTYPDITVICGKLETDPEDAAGNTAVNPKLIIEVLSPSTEEYDRSEKLSHYKKIAALEEVVLVAHEEQRLEIWRREGRRWTLEVVKTGAALLRSIDAELDIAAVYENPLPP